MQRQSIEQSKDQVDYEPVMNVFSYGTIPPTT
jgi:hypothetical protein